MTSKATCCTASGNLSATTAARPIGRAIPAFGGRAVRRQDHLRRAEPAGDRHQPGRQHLLARPTTRAGLLETIDVALRRAAARRRQAADAVRPPTSTTTRAGQRTLVALRQWRRDDLRLRSGDLPACPAARQRVRRPRRAGRADLRRRVAGPGPALTPTIRSATSPRSPTMHCARCFTAIAGSILSAATPTTRSIAWSRRPAARTSGSSAFDFAPHDGDYRDYPFAGAAAARRPAGPAAIRRTLRLRSGRQFHAASRTAPQHGGWARHYAYDEPSLLEPGQAGNRLSHTHRRATATAGRSAISTTPTATSCRCRTCRSCAGISWIASRPARARW